MKQFPVGHCHKQGLELIIPGTDLQWMGGKEALTGNFVLAWQSEHDIRVRR
jgi:hypothetical protein